jgi:Fe2+ or Zn2+ uptake regulation protein
VLEYLQQHKGHPNAEEIYEALAPEIPTLSRTTIYNTLHTFASHGLVNCLSIDGVEIRYDSMLESHGHFKCSACGSIYNFQADPDSIPTPGLEGFRIEHRNIVFTGICPDCIQNNISEKGE